MATESNHPNHRATAPPQETICIGGTQLRVDRSLQENHQTSPTSYASGKLAAASFFIAISALCGMVAGSVIASILPAASVLLGAGAGFIFGVGFASLVSMIIAGLLAYWEQVKSLPSQEARALQLKHLRENVS